VLVFGLKTAWDKNVKMCERNGGGREGVQGLGLNAEVYSCVFLSAGLRMSGYECVGFLSL